MAAHSVAHVVRPKTAQDVVDAFVLARETGRTIAPWGNGRSYGDAALNDNNIVLDMGQMDQVEQWDPQTGIVTVQPGVTIAKLWRRILPDGYWPPVVSGTSYTTIGGCASANVHGKNNWKHGPIGEHIQRFTMVTPDGQIREVTAESDPNLFHSAIGGFGALGVFVSITIKAKKVHSGRLDVQPLAAHDLAHMFRSFEEHNAQGWDYVVGWIDAFGRGGSLGRGNLHAANYVAKDVDPEGQRMFDVASQDLPSHILGYPKKWLWAAMKFWAHRPGMRFINWARYTWSTLERNQHRHLQPHAQFNFLLDFVPNWKWMYRPNGLIQIQLFLPKETAQRAMRHALELQQDMGYESWLVVMKRHRRDPFWLSHAVDGYSFAMDFPVWPKRREDLLRMARRMEKIVIDAGGRFYLAKDSVLSPTAFRASLGDEILGHFLGMKARMDPQGLLQSNQWRRVMAPVQADIPVIHLEEGQVFSVPAQADIEPSASEEPDAPEPTVDADAQSPDPAKPAAQALQSVGADPIEK
ncbi:MAG: FAD-dependent oxidoreductase [Myxococcota bacterium]